MVVGGCMVAWGACMVAGGHVWLWGACVVVEGRCMVAGGMHDCWGACVVARGACIGYDKIRSMSGRYASYWNAFLLMLIVQIQAEIMTRLTQILTIVILS